MALPVSLVLLLDFLLKGFLRFYFKVRLVSQFEGSAIESFTFTS